MYQHGYREFSIDSQERPFKELKVKEKVNEKEKKRRMSFIRKLTGGKEK